MYFTEKKNMPYKYDTLLILQNFAVKLLNQIALQLKTIGGYSAFYNKRQT